MLDKMMRYLKQLAAGLLAAALSLSPCFPSLAEEKDPRLLRVAFPQVKGMTETAEDGTRYGLVVDYLTEIAKYTGWEYEYVDVENGDELLEGFENGLFDLMGGTYYMPGLEEHYAYPDHNTGYSRAALLARRDDQRFRGNDLESMNGKTIGVYVRAAENIRRLKEFLSINNLSCTLREYTYEELTPNGNLYEYLQNGEIDLLLGNFTERADFTRMIASFDSQPYYIVTTLGNQEVLDGLNMALARILDANPNFGAERYAANFSDWIVDIQLTDGEREYIRSKKTATVAVPENWHPLFCQTESNEIHDGLVPDVLEKITEFTGLEFTFVKTENYIDAIRLVQEGKADILGFFLDSEGTAMQQGLALTASYANVNNMVARNKASSFPAESLTGAVIEGQQIPSCIPDCQVRYFANVSDALLAVNRGEIDFVHGLSTVLEQEIQRQRFTNLVPVSLAEDNSSISFALARPVVPDLLTILNKAINSISSEEKSALLNQNMISVGTSSLSVVDFIYAYPLVFIGALAVILLTVVTAVLLTARARLKAAAIQNNLEKAKAESKAKGEFLSRMSHEIRTPMNAVVGLADLTCMMEEVPESVRENLSRIRSSSQYLLGLINDILDMSRIDSGMLSIASEPFSVEQMLDNLKSMMDSEAERRSLTFSMETDISHGYLIGDAIRLRQVLTNLLSNAFKFTPAGGRVALRIQESEGNNERASFTFRVADSGIGIRSEDQQRIFDSFEQLGSSTSKSQGTGLGLSISSSIVKLMGGELKVNSRPGQGSEFYFTVTLPVGEPENRPKNPPEGRMLTGVRILLAEDNDLNADIATQILEMRGADVCWKENGRLAVERFARSEPGEFQIILMDIQMPEMNGLEATRAIRALSRPDAASIPIVAMTANSFKEDSDAARDAGMNGFLTKPLDVKHLYRVLNEFLNT